MNPHYIQVLLPPTNLVKSSSAVDSQPGGQLAAADSITLWLRKI